MKYQIGHFIVNSRTTLKLALAPGGGAAVSLKPASHGDMEMFKPIGR
jgi:hypothetical protein